MCGSACEPLLSCGTNENGYVIPSLQHYRSTVRRPTLTSAPTAVWQSAFVARSVLQLLSKNNMQISVSTLCLIQENRRRSIIPRWNPWAFKNEAKKRSTAAIYEKCIRSRVRTSMSLCICYVRTMRAKLKNDMLFMYAYKSDGFALAG